MHKSILSAEPLASTGLELEGAEEYVKTIPRVS